MVREARYKAAYKCAMSEEKFEWAACVFVDNATYFINSEDNNANKVAKMTQERQDELEELIKATGGAINKEKSKWWMLISE